MPLLKGWKVDMMNWKSKGDVYEELRREKEIKKKVNKRAAENKLR